jgi:hypothetical protein
VSEGSTDVFGNEDMKGNELSRLGGVGTKSGDCASQSAQSHWIQFNLT